MMAFGNMGDDCGTGVAFTRDPATGEKKLMGEFLTNAQGEDVVAGVRTPTKRRGFGRIALIFNIYFLRTHAKEVILQLDG